uniref:Putative tick kunitz 1 n=1 Tax=Amblyomma cajennense TaxID=34607 RepID=A0A023FRR1_AMBCJ
MILPFIAALLCLSATATFQVAGTNVDGEAEVVIENKSLPISSRASPSNPCKKKITRKLSGCPGLLEIRYGYNKATGKCEDFESMPCNDGIGNQFQTRQECFKTCKPRSPCLKTDWTEGKMNGTWYYYDTEEDDCLKKTARYKKSQMFPKGNIFQSAAECRKECTPTFDHTQYEKRRQV